MDMRDLSPIRIAPIYYKPIRFREYEIVYYKSKNIDEFKLLQEFDDQYRSDYIIGVGTPLDYHDSQYPVGSYEWFMSGAEKFDDTALLQCALTAGIRLLIEGKYRTGKIEDWQKKILVEFCLKYGLDRMDEVPKVMESNGDSPPYEFGCNVWSYIRGIEELSIQLYRMEQILDHPDQFKWSVIRSLIEMGVPSHNGRQAGKDFFISSTHCEANISEMCLYSIKEKRMKSFQFANSLLDVASYQLSKVMADGAFIRKCANPACPQVIIGGRSDKKTCSNACRKALERYQKNRPQC